jgi:hypothetical protein
LSETKDQWHALPRIAVAERINEIDDTPNSTLSEALAIDYQLVTKHTNFLILDVKAVDDKAEDLPQLAQVRQMLAAGWGGTSTVMDTLDMPMFSRTYSPAVVRMGRSIYSVMEPAMAMSLMDKSWTCSNRHVSEEQAWKAKRFFPWLQKRVMAGYQNS